jgi:hypothetical protein
VTAVVPDITPYIPLKFNHKQSLPATCFHVAFLLGLFSDVEDGSDVFL